MTKKENFLFLNTIRKIPITIFEITKNSQNGTFDLKVCVKNKPKTPISTNDLLFHRHSVQFFLIFSALLSRSLLLFTVIFQSLYL